MTELTQAAGAKELGSWPVKGWTWAWQRSGRYGYRKCLTHLTNPDHLGPSVPSPTNAPPLRIGAPYAAGRPRLRGVEKARGERGGEIPGADARRPVCQAAFCGVKFSKNVGMFASHD